MENNIKQAMESVDVPMDKLDVAILAGVQSQKKKPTSYLKKSLLASVAVGILIIGSGFISPKMADVLANVPIIRAMYNVEQDDKGLHVALSDENKVVLNETVTSAGISVTFEEIVYDGERLNVIFSMDEYRDIYPLTILVNGEAVNNGESLRELEGEGNFRGLWEIKIEEELPEAFDLTIIINYIEGIAGDWQISTPITKVNNNRQTYVAGQTGQIEGIDFEVENVVTSSTSTTVAVKFDSSATEFFEKNLSLNATITDQDGKPMHLVDRRMDGKEKETTYKYILEPITKDITELKIAFYYIPFMADRIEISEPLKNNFPQRISLGEMGDIVITGVTENGIESIVNLKIESGFAYDDKFTPNYVDLTNAVGESLVTKYIKSVGANEYELSCQNNAGQPYVHTLEMPVIEVESSAKVVVPLNKMEP